MRERPYPDAVYETDAREFPGRTGYPKGIASMDSPTKVDTGNGRSTAEVPLHENQPPRQRAEPPAHAPDGTRISEPHSNVAHLHDPNYHPGQSHWWLWLIIIAVLAAITVFAYPRVMAHFKAVQATSGPGGAGKGGGRDVPVVAQVAVKGDLKIYIDGLGTVTPFASVTLRTRVDGQIMKINFQEGEMVKEGEPLIEIDPRPYEVQLTQAQGALARDAAQLSSAQQDLKRYQEAGESAVSIQQIEEQQALVAQYQASLKVDQGQIDAAKLNIVYCHITSPLSGRLGLRLVDLGNIVHATDATGLVVINQVQPISVLFSIPQDDIPRVIQQANGGAGLLAVAFNRDLTGKAITTGKLAAADSQVDPTTGTLQLKATFSNDDLALFPKQFVNIKLLVNTLNDVLIVPAAAVQQGPDSTFVYAVKEDNTVALQNVKTGAREGDKIVITEGLEPGTKVVTDGIDKLTQGTKVSLRSANSKGGASSKPATTGVSTSQHAGQSMHQGGHGGAAAQ